MNAGLRNYRTRISLFWFSLVIIIAIYKPTDFQIGSIKSTIDKWSIFSLSYVECQFNSVLGWSNKLPILEIKEAFDHHHHLCLLLLPLNTNVLIIEFESMKIAVFLRALSNSFDFNYCIFKFSLFGSNLSFE